MKRSWLFVLTVGFCLPVWGAEQKITRKELGNDWPFTVESGVLACHGSNGFGAVTFSTSGVTYAVNGIARGQKRGVDADRIWAPNPSIPGTKKNIGEIIKRGLQLCK